MDENGNYAGVMGDIADEPYFRYQPTFPEFGCKISWIRARNKRTAALCPIVLVCLINSDNSAIGKNGKTRLFTDGSYCTFTK